MYEIEECSGTRFPHGYKTELSFLNILSGIVRAVVIGSEYSIGGNRWGTRRLFVWCCMCVLAQNHVVLC